MATPWSSVSQGLPWQPSARPSAASTSKCISRDFCPTGCVRLSRAELKQAPSPEACFSENGSTVFTNQSTLRGWGRTARRLTGPLFWLPATSVLGPPWVDAPSQARWRDRGCDLRPDSLDLPQEAGESRGGEVTSHCCTLAFSAGRRKQKFPSLRCCRDSLDQGFANDGLWAESSQQLFL